MSQPFELTFKNVLGVYNALWDFGGNLVMNQNIADHNNWLLTFRHGLKGMLARILAVDRHFVLLHKYQQQAEIKNPAQLNPNEWGLECEYHTGIILFGMDSSLECFVFAINALGFAKSPEGFCNIRDFKSLKKISPKNILGGGMKDMFNPRPGYIQYFPRVVALWDKNKNFLSKIFEYHDVSKHRSAVAQGGGLGVVHLIDNPKQPGSGMSSKSYTLQSLTSEYQKFIDELLEITIEEGAETFGCTTVKKNFERHA